MDPYEGRYRYCPRCRSEYRPGFTICADCGVELVDELPGPEPGERDAGLEQLQSWVGPDPVAVMVTNDPMEGHLARAALVAADIPSIVWETGHPHLRGPIRVMVHREDEAEARELLAAQSDSGGGWGQGE